MITERYVDPVSELGGLLLEIEKPARYVGGEFGILAKKPADTSLKTLIAFPDLYEIGMGNQALRIIYNRMNNICGISCDRAFAPAPDFEKLLRENKIPLYGLDTGISLACLDLLMFTVGYELGLNGILTMLDVSGIPLHCAERNIGHPIVIAGGPAVSNPLAFSPFIDAFWTGEAEAGFFDLAAELVQLKKRGQGRVALLEKIAAHPSIWVRGKEKARRAIAAGFAEDDTAAAVFPVPSMKIVQHHGTVEIMRGCPNGCRFCHAGFWYRPMRQKTAFQILSEAKEMVTKGGWRQISLSSLSSGDYSGVGELVENLNALFKSRHVSFQMPSLKVSGFSLDLLEKISVTRKSGITFAVETPDDAWQMAINKEVTRDSVVAIIEEAKKRGWRTAKFYFMIGLPVHGEKTEESEIVNFIIDVGRRTRMRFNINVGIFIPKPHTPYQRAAQLESAAASEKLDFIRAKLKPLGHKVSVSDPLISQIEGLLSRGDERAGLVCEKAYRRGSRLDAWNEYINRDEWRLLLEENRDLIGVSRSFDSQALPWGCIDSCVTEDYLFQELEKSNNSQRTLSCEGKCSSCGVCGKKVKISKNHAVNRYDATINKGAPQQRKSDSSVFRVLFSFSKQGTAVFHGHLSLIEIFSMAFTRADIPVMYTQGYNPLAKIEFASPLSTGISADGEIASADFYEPISVNKFIESLNGSFPQGIRIINADVFHIPVSAKKHSLASLLWGFSYAPTGCSGKEENDYVKSSQEKVYRKSRLEKNFPGKDPRHALFSLRRIEVLARNVIDDKNEWCSYFDAYRFLYPDNC